MSGTTAPGDEFGVCAGAYTARLRAPSELAHALRSTLHDLIVDAGPTSGEALVEAEPGGTYRVSADGRLYQEGIPADAVPDFVVRMLLLAELDANLGQLHLHGGLVALGDAGVLVAGVSGSGKTTLIAALVRAGFDYVTDERVAIDVERGIATGFPKPISIVPGSFPLFPELDPAATGAGQAAELVWQVPVSSFAPGSLRAEAPIRLVVIVQYREGAQVHVEALHPVPVASELLSDSPDYQRFGAEATVVATALCAQATCVRLTYHRLDDAERAIRELLSGAPSAVEIEVLEPIAGPRTRAGGGRLAASHVLTRCHDRPIVVVDGRALAYARDGAHLVELDEVSTGWLMLVDGRATVAELVDVVQRDTGVARGPLQAGALRVLRTLAVQGLVGRAR